ncbi:MAG: hypothetical protein KAS21_09525, partial [Candidatus Aminicenantes bacterium]|nr:hypothetical protein [Candidatus Aminicenantes bacterium]
SAAFSYYALAMSFICIDLLLSRSLFALEDTTFPAIFEIISISFHIIFAISFKSSGIHIISLAFLLNRIIKSILLYIRFRLKTGFHLNIGFFTFKIISFLLVNMVFVRILKNSVHFFQNGGAFTFLTLAFIFALLYFAELYFFGILKEIIKMFRSDKAQI